MAQYDIGPQWQALLADKATLALLPHEFLQQIQTTTTTTTTTTEGLLNAVAEAALAPRCTGPLFVHFAPLFADICARWLLRPRSGAQDAVVAAFARVLPLAPYLSILLDAYLSETGASLCSLGPLYHDDDTSDASLDPDNSLPILLALWRLVHLDQAVYAPLVPAGLQRLFRHAAPPVRYVAIRLFCLVHAAADFTLEALLRKHIGEDESLVAELDGRAADYAFLTLYEHTRCQELHERLAAKTSSEVSNTDDAPISTLIVSLTPLVRTWGRSVVPCPAPLSDAAAAAAAVPAPVPAPVPVSELVPTPTTLANLEAFAQCLQQRAPILLRGPPGAGKTSLVRDVARALGTDAGLVTLHLNEQTDAKALLGLYVAGGAGGATPGAFAWRPGVLTTAVQEGRWVLIEDVDRAPAEVMSTLLPLVERRELVVPSRRETVRAARGFRLFATVRTAGQLATSLLGERLWQTLAVQPVATEELPAIVQGRFPALQPLVADILAVFAQLTEMTTMTAAKKTNVAVERPVTLRDLLKWCRRMEHVLARGRQTAEAVSETTLLGFFLDAVDCFAGSVRDARARRVLGLAMAQALRIAPAVAEHALAAHEPALQDGGGRLVVGRASLTKNRSSSQQQQQRAGTSSFAPTAHARRLLEQIAVAVSLREPVLLVGETGIGKTTVVQQLAAATGRRLVAVNLSQQSEVGDLLGGFKPVQARSLAVPLQDEFAALFAATGLSAEKNAKYLKRISASVARGKWADACRLWQQAPRLFAGMLQQMEDGRTEAKNDETTQAPKRRKTRRQALAGLQPRWQRFAEKLEQFAMQIAASEAGSGFAFAFVEGKIVQAVRNGDWLLLDEINLASPDTLESIADLLAGGGGGGGGGNDRPSLLLAETGAIDKIEAHPDFRVFGAMNPATDVGKRDLPVGLRSRFTELYVASPDAAAADLVPIVKTYLRGQPRATERVVERVARLYLAVKQLAGARRLVDGAGEVPHYSLRTLTRVLRYADDVAALYGLERALYEGFSMGFLTLLSAASEELVLPLLAEHLLGGDGAARRILTQPPRTPADGQPYVRFFSAAHDRQYWLLQGPNAPADRADYIRTASVERNLLNLVRATSTRRFPVLIQGPTSAGKTSMIEYLAQRSGNVFVRINNHEHTDLQEYLGSYVSSDGGLRFQEGVLVRAMRQGHWLVLDELNLAPTDVLEALNRLLDDNRELLIPETQEVVRPHARFMLFATQNPAGLYGGRKALSRAFRNRFLELHFDDIPEAELGQILERRCRATAPSDCARIVAVYRELARRRQTGRVFESKHSFATLRDLFRWALRDAADRQQIARHGFMLLGERVRDDAERAVVRDVIETVFKTKLDLDGLYAPSSASLPPGPVVWTHAMRRLFVLVSTALANNEPVLLVGETGCGKTTLCQVLAEAAGRPLHAVNAHQNTETGDLIGSQRPVRNRAAVQASLVRGLREAIAVWGDMPVDDDTDVDTLLAKYKSATPEQRAMLPPSLPQQIDHDAARFRALFEWADGSLVTAMKTGAYFLLDEISLADDSVLERLNSVLEPQRTLLLAERASGADDDDPNDDLTVTAATGFQFLATMNPGGDFGKKELSPALRNRFTEIWVPPVVDEADVRAIVAAALCPEAQGLDAPMVAFAGWFGCTFRAAAAAPFSVRDLLGWAQFANACWATGDDAATTANRVFALVHGAATVFIDTLGANPSALVASDPASTAAQRQRCLEKLALLLGAPSSSVADDLYWAEPAVRTTEDALWVGSFHIPRRPGTEADAAFALDAPTTRRNVLRVVRALQMTAAKPLLLEGNPGVGKTTLVAALAQACGQPLTRINLSDQTDLMDLFGTDVPVEGAAAGHFAWRAAPFLQALQRGEWVLLDEMNLASQAVLEGLNACLDHRGEVYVAELDQTFRRHPDFRLFAAQNPHHQGGGRKGLPASFVNRFVVVHADVLTEEDQLRIARRRFPGVPAPVVQRITAFVASLEAHVAQNRLGVQGAPWEFNLRDTLRWLDLLRVGDEDSGDNTDPPLDILVRQRFRTPRDRAAVAALFTAAFGRPPAAHSRYHAVGAATAQVGNALLPRGRVVQPTPPVRGLRLAPRLAALEALLVCVRHNLPVIVTGPAGAGKSALVQQAAALVGATLVSFPLSADVDAMDLVGGFAQADVVRDVQEKLGDLGERLGRWLLATATQDGDDNEATKAATAASAALQAMQTTDFPMIADALARLAPLVDDDEDLLAALHDTRALLQQPPTASPRFEWLDSVLVHAAQVGHWLVLDNANLCHASVLDRLNSLLERPHGFLSINEHSAPDGSPRVVDLHQAFRVFLTVDPRHGELSRAMRNRGVELFLDALPDLPPQPFSQYITPVEARMQRFLDVVVHAADPLALDNLALADAALLPRFVRAVEEGGLGDPAPSLLDRLRSALAFVTAADAQPVRDAVLAQHAAATERVADADADVDTALLVHEQPLHPLQNTPLQKPLLASRPGWWTAVRYEAFTAALRADAMLQADAERAAAGVAALAQLSRVQRSALAGRVALVARDSTANAFRFLHEVVRLLRACILADNNAGPADGDGRAARLALHIVGHLWRRTHELAGTAPASSFDEAQFQAHLSHGRRLLTAVADNDADGPVHTLVAQVLAHLEADFAAGFALATGRSMGLLWPVLRPRPIPDEQMFAAATSLGRLAGRFDGLKWRVPAAAGVADLGRVQAALVEAYGALRAGRVDAGDAATLVQAVADEIARLEGLVNDNHAQTPLLADIFEAVRQLHVLHGVPAAASAADRLATLVLADLPTVAQLRLQSVSVEAEGSLSPALQTVDYLLAHDAPGGDDTIHPWSGTLSATLLRRVAGLATADDNNSTASLSLAALAALEQELPLAGRVVAQAAALLLADPVARLATGVWDVLAGVLGAHAGVRVVEALRERALQHPRVGDVVVSEAGLVIDATTPAQDVLWPDLADDVLAALPEHVRVVMTEHFVPAIVAVAVVTTTTTATTSMRVPALAVAWVHCALGCIALYTPDKVFDPFLTWQTEHAFGASLHAVLAGQAEALRAFERACTGQEATRATSLRLALAEDDLAAWDAMDDHKETSKDVVYRPSGGGQLARLQREVFRPVLDATVLQHGGLAAAVYAAETTQLQLVQRNVARLVERLLTSFPAYQDLAVPLANLLRCLQVGLSLRLMSGSDGADGEEETTAWLPIVPFLGGRVCRVEDVPAALTKTRAFLQFAGVCRSIDDDDDGFSNDGRRRVLEAFHHFYDEWAQQRAADRKAEEDRGNLYRYRGGEEDDEAAEASALRELFPTYDEEEGEDDDNKKKGPTTKTKTPDLSADLARVHRNILQPTRSATDAVLDLCTATAKRVAKAAGGNASCASPAMDAALLPAALLAIDDQRRALDTDPGDADYNFYADPHLPESRRLVALVHDVQAVFRGLQAVEEIGHLQPLADVLLACDRVLALGFMAPLAQLLPRVEALHAFVHEWQVRGGGYAGLRHTAPSAPLYARLTATLVGWRQRELQTWRRLLDAEAAACARAADGWWCVAYEAVVTGPVALARAGDLAGLTAHTEHLLAELAAYLSSSIVGQFAARLALLRQLAAHLRLLAHNYAALDAVAAGVSGLVAFYERHTPRAAAAIKTGRAALEKAMRDVLLLASWRDTNIDALRESAKRSHMKLTRLVRKFRGVLGQVVGEGELPGMEDRADDVDVDDSLFASSVTAPESIDTARLGLPPDDAHTQRLARPARLVARMAAAAALPPTALDAAAVATAFAADLAADMRALRRETPPTLTDENRDAVQHLKTRKARLLDDTVRAVRAMGFSTNPGAGRLAAQASLAVIFAGPSGRAARLPAPLDLPGAEDAWHHLLDLAPRVREAHHAHHADLPRMTVRRVVGLLEGVLAVAVQQRDVLARAAPGLAALDRQVQSVATLATAAWERTSVPSDRGPRWLVAMLRVASRLVEVHARLAGPGVACKPVQAALASWTARLDARCAALASAPVLPHGFVSAEARVAQTEAAAERQQLATELAGLAVTHPELAYILRQVQMWAEDNASGVVEGNDKTQEEEFVRVDAFTTTALTLSKMVLDAVQKLARAHAALPTAVDDDAWLVQASTQLAAAARALRADTVGGALEACIHQLPTGDHATGLLRLLLPLLQQYAATHRHALLRLAALHRATCRLGQRLARAFVDVAAHGFCAPHDPATDSETTESKQGQLEDGTGLGDGQGAEDISKDIQPDEDLSELAQTAGDKDKKDEEDGGIEDEKDAVDMTGEEMEGELGSTAGDDEDDDDKKKGDDDDDEDADDDDMDEEAGDVDDLDPTAVDEKMWDGDDDDDDKGDDKEQQGNEAKGQEGEDGAAADETAKPQQSDDAQAAAEGEEGKRDEKEEEKDEKKDDKDGEDGEGGDDGEDDAASDADIGSDDEQAGPQQELNRQDQDVDHNDVLDLPDDMELDKEEGADEEDADDDDDLGDLEQMADGEKEEMEEGPDKKNEDKTDVQEEDEQEVKEDKDAGDEAHGKLEDGDEMDEDDEDGQAEDGEADGEGEAEDEGQDAEDADSMDVDKPTPAGKPDKPAPSDVQSGVGPDQDNTAAGEEQEQQDDAAAAGDQNNSSSNARREQGDDRGMPDADDDEEKTAGGDGVATAGDNDGGPSAADADHQQQQQDNPFKKLGDVLERWHRTRRDIRAADKETEEEAKDKTEADLEKAQQDFQHVHDDEAEGTTQAMGTADAEDAKPVDDAMAVDEEKEEGVRQMREDEGGEVDAEKHAGNEEGGGDEEDEDEDEKMDDNDDDNDGARKTEGTDGRAGATMQRGAYEREEEEEGTQTMEREEDDDDDEDDLEDDDLALSQRLSLDDNAPDADHYLLPPDDAARRWAAAQAATHPLSQALAAQLRLILAPSQATRLSGGFRTGKRLSIRRIIPYIASGYKRDKIWMRRTMPTRRAYQILLCVDDSRSMGGVGAGQNIEDSSPSSAAGSSAGHLALTSLVMVGRALALLEAGQVGVLGFGERVFEAHPLEGADPFGATSTTNPGAALRPFTFQQDRTDVALLLRAVLDRFRGARARQAAGAAGADLWQLALILSDGLTPSGAHERIRLLLREAAEARIMVVFVVLDGAGAAKDSVLDLKEARFVRDAATGASRVVIERYLDTFPFPYYLIVHHLDDLPSALSGLLRTWFAEVNA